MFFRPLFFNSFMLFRIILNPVLNPKQSIFDLFPLLSGAIFRNRIINFQDHFRIRMTHPAAASVYVYSVIPAESAERMSKGVRHNIKVNPCREFPGLFLLPCFAVLSFADSVDGCFHIQYFFQYFIEKLLTLLENQL